AREKLLRQQYVVGIQTLKCGRALMPWVLDQKLVQPGRAAPPVADDKNGRLADSRSPNALAVEQLLDMPQYRIPHAHQRDEEGDVDVRPFNGESIFRQQPEPGEKLTPFPDPRRPLSASGLAVGGTSHMRLYLGPVSRWLVYLFSYCPPTPFVQSRSGGSHTFMASRAFRPWFRSSAVTQARHPWA